VENSSHLLGFEHAITLAKRGWRVVPYLDRPDGALFNILNNGRYAVMDRLAEKSGSAEPAWPPFDEIDFVDLSQSLGVSATRLSDYAALRRTLEEIVPTLATRNDPHVLVIDVEPEQHFAP
jgi:benzoylformate decarboxylase